jgi:hypothetical protein
MGEPILDSGGRTVPKHTEFSVGLDAAKAHRAVEIAEEGRQGEIR